MKPAFFKCTVCGEKDGQSYHVGAVRGHLCKVCLQGAGIALAAWTVKRMREVQREQDMAARRANEERVLDAAREDVANEQLPLSTRRAMREAAKGAA